MAEDCGSMKIATTAGKSVFYRSWYEAIVKYIKDLITDDTLYVFHHTFGVKTHFCSIDGFLTLFPLDGKRNSRIATRKIKVMTAKLRSLIHKIFQGGGRNRKTAQKITQNRNKFRPKAK